MKIKVLGCSGGQMPGSYMSGFLLDGSTLIDAGTIAQTASMAEQRKIKQAFISHAHLDHIGGLPFFAVNITSNKGTGVDIHSAQVVLDAIKDHLMNGLIWPDFTKIKNSSGSPVFTYNPMETGKWMTIGGYNIMAVPVNHTVPTTGFLIGKGSCYILYSGDTKDTDAIWAEAKKLGKKLKSVFIEMAYPDELAALAELSGHLTPKTLEMQLKKLSPLTPKIYLYHLKPEYVKQIQAQVKKIRGYKFTFVSEGKAYKI